MIIISWLELIVAIVLSVLYFTGAWVPSAFAIGVFLVLWVINVLCSFLNNLAS